MAHISLSSQKTIQTFQTETYQECFSGLNKEYHNKVNALIEGIIQAPLRKSEVMKSDYEGLRKRKRAGSVFCMRIVRIVEIVDDVNRGCASCKDMVDETIIFFYVGLKGILYEDR